jgi:hypothetical protein
VPRVSSFELPISASHIHLLRVLPLVGCRSKTPIEGKRRKGEKKRRREKEKEKGRKERKEK